MVKRTRRSPLAKAVQRAFGAMTRATVRAGSKTVGQAMEAAVAQHRPPPGPGDWISGLAAGAGGTRRYYLFRPPGVSPAERLPLMVLLHGCGQTASSFARSTRMNRIATRERFLVMYPEQDRRVNPQGCWSWFGTGSHHAYAEAATLMAAIDQACLLYPVDPDAIAVAGISAGASMAALLATLHPERFKAVVMHSGVPPGTAHSSASALSAMRGRRAPATPVSAEAWPPLLVIHGSADRIVAAANGQAAAQLWAAAVGARRCAPRVTRRGKRHAAKVTDFKRGARVAVSLNEIDSLGHAWSGGAAKQPFSDPQGPDASRLAWAFFARQLRARSAARPETRRV